jgi:ABC-type spermidine/putrescine transport system permease subunit II
MPSFSRALLVGYAAVIFAALLLPIAIVVLYAFSADAGLTFPPSGLSLRWFRYVAERRELVTATWISLQVAALASAASVGLGLLASLTLVRGRVPGKEVIDAALMSPLALPGIITGVALLQFMSLIGFTDSFWRLVVAHVVVCTPYAIRSISASLYGIDPHLEEASRVMGAGPWRTFRRVVLPLLRPGIAAGYMFCFITSFDNVIVSIYLISADTVTLPIRILTYLEWQFDPSVAAICTVLVLVTTLLVLAAEALAGLSKPVSPRG